MRRQVLWFTVLAGLALLLATCAERRAQRPQPVENVAPEEPPKPKPKAKPKHGLHEHAHGAHPHARDAHHHHPHPHPHVEGADGHHHPN